MSQSKAVKLAGGQMDGWMDGFELLEIILRIHWKVTIPRTNGFIWVEA
jgi:hypothetical protein